MIRWMLASLAMAAGLFGAGGAAAQDWMLTDYAGSAPQRVAFFVDMRSVRHDGQIVEYRSQTVYEGIDGDRKFNQSLIRVRGDCTKHATMYLGDSYYFNGTLVSSSDEADTEFVVEKPHSVGETTLLVACGIKTPVRRYADPNVDYRREW